MKTKILFFAAATMLSIFSFANTIQVGPLQEALQVFRSTNQLPILVALQESSIVVSNEQIPEDVQKLFKEIQKFVFGNETVINLKACDGCQAVAKANAMTVYLEINFLNKLITRFGTDSKNIIALVVAHEISHFTYEYLTLSSSSKLSPNGNIPLLTKSFVDFVDLKTFLTMTADEQQDETLKYVAMASRSHSEVDLLALLTLKGMGQKISADAIKYLEAEVNTRTPEERAQTDFEFRLKSLTDIISKGDL